MEKIKDIIEYIQDHQWDYVDAALGGIIVLLLLIIIAS
tara:strand:+ start:1023 stop:1136 length:114 start_codon:yes stop_codon:yes gene_type:complete